MKFIVAVGVITAAVLLTSVFRQRSLNAEGHLRGKERLLQELRTLPELSDIYIDPQDCDFHEKPVAYGLQCKLQGATVVKSSSDLDRGWERVSSHEGEDNWRRPAIVHVYTNRSLKRDAVLYLSSPGVAIGASIQPAKPR